MIESQAVIERVRRISATLQRVELGLDKTQREVSAGQFFLARMTESHDPYLREPWIPIEKIGSGIIIERPARQLFTPGEVVNLIGPLGRPIPLRDSIRTLLLVAYESTPAALLMLANQVLARNGAVTLALIGRAGEYPLDALPAEVEVVRCASHEAWTERAKAVGWADQIVAVAPPPYDLTSYLKLLDTVREVRIQPAADAVYGLFHPPLPCGVGACQACLIRLQGGEDAPACVDGPVFDLTTVNLVIVEKTERQE